MIPINFENSNIVFGKDQPQYNMLPAHRDESGVVTTCWELTPEERIEILETGKIYLQQYTFNDPLQPVRILLENPVK